MYWYRPCWCLLLLRLSIRTGAEEAMHTALLRLIFVGEIQIQFNEESYDGWIALWRGICMKGSRSRPILSFDEAFTVYGSSALITAFEMCVHRYVWHPPRGHPTSKPFVDRFFCFWKERARKRKSMIINTMSVCQTWVWQPGSENTTSNIVLRLRWHEIFFPPCFLCSLFFSFWNLPSVVY